MIEVVLPKTDEPKDQIIRCLDISRQIDLSCKESKGAMLDMSNLCWILPCAALILASKIKKEVEKGCVVKVIEPKSSSVRIYLESLGFPMGRDGRSKSFIPIHYFTKSSGEDSTKIIDKEIKEIFEIVKEKFPSKESQAIYYLLGELSDNIDQHSNFNNGSIMLQYYPQKGWIDIGVLDDGETIPTVFKKNNLGFQKDYEAISQALKGVSTKTEQMGRGWGLKTSKKLVSEGFEGSLHVLSGNGFVTVSHNKENQTEELPSKFQGTLIYLRFKATEKDLNIFDYLE